MNGTGGIVRAFDDPVVDGTLAFRGLMQAQANPGRIVTLSRPPGGIGGLCPAAFAVLLTLCDSGTPLYLEPSLTSDGAADHLRFHAGCPLTEDPSKGHFVVLNAETGLAILARVTRGTADYPDRGATAILQVPAMSPQGPLTLTGPGIETSRRLGLGIDAQATAALLEILGENHALFPMGFDLFLACGRDIAALPRTTKVELN